MLGEAASTESSPFWWLADKALLSGTQGSHEWLCKQPKREGTFPLAESAVKRFPVTVIAAFGGIISVVAVGGGGKESGRQGKAGRRLVCLHLAQRRMGTRGQTQSDYLGARLVFGQAFWTSYFPQMDRSPLPGVPPGKCTLILCCLCLDYLSHSFPHCRASYNFLASWDLQVGKLTVTKLY